MLQSCVGFSYIFFCRAFSLSCHVTERLSPIPLGYRPSPAPPVCKLATCQYLSCPTHTLQLLLIYLSITLLGHSPPLASTRYSHLPSVISPSCIPHLPLICSSFTPHQPLIYPSATTHLHWPLQDTPSASLALKLSRMRHSRHAFQSVRCARP